MNLELYALAVVALCFLAKTDDDADAYRDPYTKTLSHKTKQVGRGQQNLACASDASKVEGFERQMFGPSTGIVVVQITSMNQAGLEDGLLLTFRAAV